MRLAFKNTFWGYFQFYYSIIGNRLFVNLGLSICISFLDGLGLAMFIPLLQAVGGDGKVTSTVESNDTRYFSDFLGYFGINLTITSVLFFLILLFTLKGLIKFIQMNYQIKIRLFFIKKIRFGLVDSLKDLAYKGFLKLDAGTIQNTLTTEVQKVFQSMNFYLLAAQSFLMLMTYVALAFIANYQFAFLVAVGAGLSNFIYRRIYISTKKASRDLSKKHNDFNSFLIQSIHHFKYLKATNYFDAFSFKLKDVIAKSELLNEKMGYYAAITNAVREPMIIIIVAIVILVQTTLMGSTMASIMLSLLLFYRSLSFLMVVQNNWQSFVQTTGSIDSVANLTIHMNDEKEPQHSLLFSGLQSGIELRGVNFGYNDYEILKNLNVYIPKSKTVALVGESGSGKTTLANLISGLISPKDGDLYIDDINLNELNLDSYRSRIGYISQEPVIFNDSIYNNITFWAERTPDNETRFQSAVKLASLSEFIQKQPQNEFTVLGDNGILISGGQKQRISIARELFKDAEILILDEATSALDSETEKVIQDNVEKLHGRFTMIIIAHRLSTIRNADLIYLMENGMVKESGTFDDLLKKSDKFRTMVALQEI